MTKHKKGRKMINGSLRLGAVHPNDEIASTWVGGGRNLRLS